MPRTASLTAMSDLTPATRRAALRRGVVVAPHDSDRAVLEIARLVGLPKPRATNEVVDDGRLLRFVHAPPARLERS